MKIDTVIFDMGGTIENIYYDRETKFEATKQIFKCLEESSIDLKLSLEDFFTTVLEGMEEYKKWSEKTFIESSPTIIWHKWVLKDFNIPVEKIEKISERLAFVWETIGMIRNIKKEAPQTFRELKKRNYKLGIISNTQSYTQVYYSLDKYGIKDFFNYIFLSSVEGIRKPDRRIFDKAIRSMNSVPEMAVYIGDSIEKDIIGAKSAGFSIAIQIISTAIEKNNNDVNVSENRPKPDYLITNLLEIVEILDKENSQK